MLDVEKLKQLLGQRAGYGITSAADCERLAIDIQADAKETISANTLKRLLGILPYNKTHRMSTLDIVARYIGYGSWRELEKSADGIPSDFGDDANAVNTDALAIGSLVEVTYAPNRRIVFRCQGEGYFVVEESENSKLAKGDEAMIRQFAIGSPLLANNVIHDGQNMGKYTAAKIGGIMSIKL